MGLLRITWRRSAIGYHTRQREVLRALGLRRLHHTVVHQDSPSIRGMVHKVQHLLEVEVVEAEQA
ncbi:MAG: 50S ribosomal protein L30 [Dehalococcoidia bacterium]